MSNPFQGRMASITVPMVPPSVNRYVRHTRTGRHYVTEEALVFMGAIAQLSRRQSVRGKAYKLEAWVYFGKGKRGDGDNLWKCIADGLVKAGVIDTDAKVINWHLYKRRDPRNPRTEIVVEAIEL